MKPGNAAPGSWGATGRQTGHTRPGLKRHEDKGRTNQRGRGRWRWGMTRFLSFKGVQYEERQEEDGFKRSLRFLCKQERRHASWAQGQLYTHICGRWRWKHEVILIRLPAARDEMRSWVWQTAGERERVMEEVTDREKRPSGFSHTCSHLSKITRGRSFLRNSSLTDHFHIHANTVTCRRLSSHTNLLKNDHPRPWPYCLRFKH